MYGRWIALLILFFTPSIALAHPGHDHAGLGAGFLHPLSGLDHLLVLLGIGFWAARSGLARGSLAAGAAVLAALAGGFALGLAQGPLPVIEFGIVASVLLTGLLVFFGARLPVAFTAAIAAGFAVLHGFAHGAEMAAGLSAVAFLSGFLVASSILLAAGAGLAVLTRGAALERPTRRAAGGVLVVASVYLLIVV